WSTYHTEVRCWPLAAIERVEPRDEPVAVSSLSPGELTKAEVLRRLHRDAEEKIKVVSEVYGLILWPLVIVALSVLVGIMVLKGPGFGPRPYIVASGVLTALGCVLLFAV